MDTRTLQIVHEFDNEPTYIVTRDDHHEDIATVEPTTPNAVQVADELVRRWNAYPELVAALEEALRTLVTPQGFPDAKHRTQEQQRAYDRARAAINKAKNPLIP